MGPCVRGLCRVVSSAALVLVATAARAEAQSPQWTLFFASQAGDSIGQGQTRTFTNADGTLTIGSSTNSVSARLMSPSFATSWSADFSAPTGTSLLPGVYNTARRYPFSTFNGLSFSYASNGCNQLTGRFVVLEAVYGSGGTVLTFAADFEQHCNDAAPGLFGAIRYNSSIAATPFGGVYPSYSLAIPTPSNGTIASNGTLTCGTGGAACSETFGAATSVTLTATPDAGYIFAGWTGDCRGGATTSVHVNGPKQCGARFELDASPSPRTLFVFDSQPGDATGGGKQQFYNDANSRIRAEISSGTLTFSVLSIDATSTLSWSITMRASGSDALTPGTYEGALGLSGPWPRLQVGFCSNSFGRFIVRELVLGSGDTVVRAAVDLEFHCPGSTDAGFFAALRFNSADSTTVPFGASYPTYRLTIAPPANGTIVGGALTCGTGGGACELNPSSPTSVTLTPVPDAGYMFAGWIGTACVGSPSATVRINSVKTCAAVFEPLVTTVPRTLAFLDYMPGASSTGSAALREGFSGLASQWTASSSFSGRTVDFNVTMLGTSGFTTSRRFVFSAPSGQALTPGTMYWAVRHPFPSASPGMDVTSNCNRLTGRFLVREISITSNGTVERAAIDFEEHCNDIDAAVFGTVRYNSSLEAIPFGGDYPRYRVVVPPPTGGRVSGAGLDCHAATGPCQVDFGGPASITVTATADAGYRFAGWTGLCHGGESITFRLNTVRQCAALFELIPPLSPRAYLKMAGQPGDKVLGGRTEIYSLPNSLWSVSAGLEFVTFNVSGLVDADEARWGLTFRAPTGQQLKLSTPYTDATSSFSSGLPTLQLHGGGFCSVTASTFTVRELQFGSQNRLLRAAVDFEVHCDTISSPALVGTIAYAEATDASRLSLDRSRLSFTSTRVGNDIGQTTAPQTLRLSQSTGANVSWSLSVFPSWLRVTPTSGSGPATLTVSVEPAGLVGLGTQTGTILVFAGGESLPPVTVTWTVLPGAGAPPFGRFETPVALTQDLTGAVALTGWALDDVEVTGVQIWRQPHPADSPAAIFQGLGPRNGKVYVGDATLVDGARPDVEAAYALPYRSRAGWGYMLLTRALIWDGQGLFTVHAIATDRDGHTTEIGSTSFSVNNAVATKPFGTIDTPGQGITVSGLYPQTGWVLSPNPGATIVPSNVRVLIDGVPLAAVPSVAARADITAVFPGFDTSQAGRGLFIDTTTLADGLHTIAWLATDSTGQADGIGSRYFKVANGGSSSVTAATRALARAVAGVDVTAVDDAPIAMSSIRVRTGFDLEAPFETRYGSSEPFALTVEELQRIEVRLPQRDGVTYSAYTRALGELRPLPVGAALNAVTGTFTWQVPAGYLGAYDLVFLATSRSAAVSRYEVQVTVRPRQ